MLKFIKRIAEHVQSRRLLIYNLGKFSDAPIQGTPVTDVAAFKRG
jgi:hypothetical protein